MVVTKTATVTFRFDPAVKEALRGAAAREHRSIANIVEVLIRGYCDKNNISLKEGEIVAGPITSGVRESK